MNKKISALIIVPIVIFALVITYINLRDFRIVDNKSELSQLLGGVDFSDLEIIAIRIAGGGVYVFCEGPDDVMQFDYYEYGWRDSFGIARILERVDLRTDHVRKHSYASGGSIDKNTDSVRTIDWFQLDRVHAGKGNIVIFTTLPRGTRINVNAIMSEQVTSQELNR